MPLPPAVRDLWEELEGVRAELLAEVQGLSQAQSDWRPGARDWSVGEILHHVTLAEVNTGKLTSKLLKDAGSAAAPFPPGLTALPPLPSFPPGPAEAPEAVRPAAGAPIGQLLADLRAARERTRQTIERLGAVDPRPLTWEHPRLGRMDLAQWWQLQVAHERDHLAQLRGVKAAPGFPRG
jgi:hypothetical protein